MVALRLVYRDLEHEHAVFGITAREDSTHRGELGCFFNHEAMLTDPNLGRPDY